MKVLLIGALALVTATSALAQHRPGPRPGPIPGPLPGPHYQQQEQIHLQIQQEFMGINIIPLKQEIKKQHPHINVQDIQVESVKVVAKSKFGRGEVVLISGQAASYPENIEGDPRDYDFGGPQTFDKILIQNPAPMTQGKLQLELKGNIKLHKVVVNLKELGHHGGQSIVINLGDQVIQGQYNILPLKQLAVRQNPRMDINSLELKKVILVAKSAHGMGQASLVVGQSASYPETIDGNPRMFQSNDLRTYDQVILSNPSFSSMGKWQIELQGMIKVKQIILQVKRQGGIGPGPRPGPRPRPMPRPMPRPRGRRI